MKRISKNSVAAKEIYTSCVKLSRNFFKPSSEQTDKIKEKELAPKKLSRLLTNKERKDLKQHAKEKNDNYNNFSAY